MREVPLESHAPANAAFAARPSREDLLEQFGDEVLSIHSLFQFCFVPAGRLHLLRESMLEEEWGANQYVLIKYLAVHLRLAVEQQRWIWNGDQMVFTAGRLTNRHGAPLYLGLVPNAVPGQETPWVLNWVGDRPSTPELPSPAEFGRWPALDLSKELVLALDRSDESRGPRLPALANLPVPLQTAALTGALHWSLHRGLALRQIHSGGQGYFVPLWLQNRDDLEAVPDCVAPLAAAGPRWIARALLEPANAYAPARATVERADQLPAWLLEAWDRSCSSAAESTESSEPGP
jgi:hypothetical protein